MINKGKSSLIDDYQNDTDTVDIFSMRAIKPKAYSRHSYNLKSHSNDNYVKFFHKEVYDSGYDYFIGNMVLNFKTPEVHGAGILSYCDYFGYSAISSMTVKIGDAEFVFDGEYLFNQIMSLTHLEAKNKILEEAGHNEECRKISVSEESYELIKGQQDIKVLLKLPFGESFPKNLFPIAVNDPIVINFNLRSMSSLLNCNEGFVLPSSNFSNFDLMIEIYTKKSDTRPLYEPRIDVPFKMSGTSLSVLPSRFMYISQKCQFNDRFFPFMIDNWTCEKDVIDQLSEALLDNILFVVPTDKKVEFKNSFPVSSIFNEVVNGEVIIRTNERFQQKRKVTVSITGVPNNCTLLYHSNVLVINKRYGSNKAIEEIKNPWFEDLNFSEKFMSIRGYYDSSLKKVVPLKVKHILKSQYASIPTDVFKTLGEDNRRNNSPNYKLDLTSLMELISSNLHQ